MKIFTLMLAATFSIGAFASDFDPNYDENCAKRYIRASQDLIVIAQAYNDGQIGKVEYAARVAGVDSTVLAMRAYCMNENSEAQLCVNQTKNAFNDIREKIDAREILKGQKDKVQVSILDLRRLLKGSVRGFLRGLRNGNDNICTLDASFL
jgi:nucleotidyltransferase/DNA polymerase involved in DNA repair